MAVEASARDRRNGRGDDRGRACCDRRGARAQAAGRGADRRRRQRRPGRHRHRRHRGPGRGRRRRARSRWLLPALPRRRRWSSPPASRSTPPRRGEPCEPSAAPVAAHGRPCAIGASSGAPRHRGSRPSGRRRRRRRRRSSSSPTLRSRGRSGVDRLDALSVSRSSPTTLRPPRARSRSLGGVVTGSVPGELVQASLAAGRVDEVDALRRSRSSSLPRRVNRRADRGARAELGAGGGPERRRHQRRRVARRRVSAARSRSAIIDFFDLGLWNPAEHGHAPDAAHMFCLDTSGQAPNFCPMPTDGINDGNGEEHGVAVAEVLKDMAPDAELYLATVGHDGRPARRDRLVRGERRVHHHAARSARRIDGPGDGTGPLAAVVDHAADARASRGSTRRATTPAGSYGRYTERRRRRRLRRLRQRARRRHDASRCTGTCIGFDGIRWNDWGKPAGSVTDYRVEVFDPARVTLDRAAGRTRRPARPRSSWSTSTCARSPVRSHCACVASRRAATRRPTSIEVALFSGRIEPGAARPRTARRSRSSTRATRRSSPSVRSTRRTGGALGVLLVAGPDERRPGQARRRRAVVPRQHASTEPSIYGPGACFNGTSASSPVAAGIAAVCSAAGWRGAARRWPRSTQAPRDRPRPPGPDNATGTGMSRCRPSPPRRSTVARRSTRRWPCRGASSTRGPIVGDARRAARAVRAVHDRRSADRASTAPVARPSRRSR